MRPTFRRAAAWCVLAAALGLAACADEHAASAESAGRPAAAEASSDVTHCFYPRDVEGWRAAGDRTVYVRVAVNRVYRMKLMGPCPNIDWTQRVGIQSFSGTQICSGIDATIISPTPTGPQRCPVTALTELTPAEVKALPPGDKP